jgi:hypothetical protein
MSDAYGRAPVATAYASELPQQSTAAVSSAWSTKTASSFFVGGGGGGGGGDSSHHSYSYGHTSHHNNDTTHSSTEVAFAFVNMRIKPDGGRELTLRSLLTLKNHTGRVMWVLIRRGGDGIAAAIGPGQSWNVPLQLAHPKVTYGI